MRGLLHAHYLLWVKDAPRIGHNTDDEVCAFIDKYITAVLPKTSHENEHVITMMKRLQQHTQTIANVERHVVLDFQNLHHIE